MVKRRALIVGSAGQDGTLLRIHLQSLGYSVLGISREGISGDAGSWTNTGVDITNKSMVVALLGDIRPDEIYFLAAYHHSSEENPLDEVDLFRKSVEIHLHAPVTFLEAIRLHFPTIRFFYAASSLIFGSGAVNRQDENTPTNPETVYGISKTAGLLACRRYRVEHEIYAAVGILFNHESPLRGRKFLSKKLAAGAVAVKRGLTETIALGDLTARTDWGYAPDYVDAMRRMLTLPCADEFIVATGEGHTVEEFARAAFECVGLTWSNHVVSDATLMGRKLPGLVGDPRKFMTASMWRPTVSFREMVERLVSNELEQSDDK